MKNLICKRNGNVLTIEFKDINDNEHSITLCCDNYEDEINNACIEYWQNKISIRFSELFDHMVSMAKDWQCLTDEERENWYCGDGVYGFIEQYDELMEVYTAYYELYEITEDQYFYVLADEYLVMLAQMCTNK
ncbi:MAG: hypothetical protein IKU15_00120 [Clostridia bacterium]|nr:hypothetical protein [Clostridia bacterium]